MSVDKMNREDIGRLVKDKIGFTVVVNSVAQSIHSLEACGLWMYLLSLPENWKVQRSHLEKHFDIGKDKLKKAIDHLKTIKLLEEIEVRNEQGQFCGYDILIHNEYPEADLPQAGKPAPVNPPLTNTIDNTNTINLNILTNFVDHDQKVNIVEEDLFDDFWIACPRKVKKTATKKIWDRMKLSRSMQTAIIADINLRKVSDPKWADPQYIPYPDTYLRGRRWEDEHTNHTKLEPKKTKHGFTEYMKQKYTQQTQYNAQLGKGVVHEHSN